MGEEILSHCFEERRDSVPHSSAYFVLIACSDRQVIAGTAFLNIFASVVLAIWHVPTGLKFFAFFLAGSADGIAAVIYAWANEICAGNAEERAIVISSMNTIGNTFGAWLPLL